MSTRSRHIEDAGFAAGGLLIVARGIAELVHEFYPVIEAHKHGIPWGFFMGCGLLVLPKVLGRATAGKVWEAIGTGVGRLIGRGRPAAPGESDA